MITTDTNFELSSLVRRAMDDLAIPEKPALLYEPVRYMLSLGGKRMRFCFALLSCGLCGGKPEEAIPAAKAIELLHNFTLLHDDIMDKADTRRGMPSVYKKWDTSTAILSGDVMFVKALEQLRYYQDYERFPEIFDAFLNSTRQVCEGQAYDLEFEQMDEISICDYLEMVRGKTAALIKASLLMGGTVGGADSEMKEILGELGEEIGIAFQIQDDLLDIKGEPDKLGKQSAGDILKGKKTYLSILSLERGDHRQKEFLLEVLKSNNVTQSDVQKVIALYENLDIFTAAGKAVNQHYRKALNLLDSFSSSDYREELRHLLEKIIEREY